MHRTGRQNSLPHRRYHPSNSNSLSIANAVAAFVLGSVTGSIAKPNPNRWDYTVQAGVQKFDRASGRLWTLGLENNEWFERGVRK
jgi:hypothetical protein